LLFLLEFSDLVLDKIGNELAGYPSKNVKNGSAADKIDTFGTSI